MTKTKKRDSAVEKISRRIGKKHLEERLLLEAQYERQGILFGETRLGRKWARRLTNSCATFLKALGLWERGVRNSLDYRISERSVILRRLPPSFTGFRILHLSDLHIEAIHDGGKRLRELLWDIPADLCVITGDILYETFGDHHVAVDLLEKLLRGQRYPEGILAVLGNHDPIRMIPALENIGVRVLINETVALRRGRDRIWVGGVDDPHFYELHDLSKTFDKVPSPGVRILLVHSPDIVDLACEADVDLYLCGHSHGGQICLPGGKPILVNLNGSAKYYAGSWQKGPTWGYTSCGSGASGLPVRFFSRPEIALHKLTPE